MLFRSDTTAAIAGGLAGESGSGSKYYVTGRIRTKSTFEVFFICFTTKKGRFTTSLFIVKKDMPKESVKRNHVVQIFKETDFRI